MNSYKSLKNRIDKLQPRENSGAEKFFGEISVNDSRIFHKKDHRYHSFVRVYGYKDDAMFCCDTNYADSLQQAMDIIKRELRKHTLSKCSVFHLEREEKQKILKTVFELVGDDLVNKYPENLNMVIPDNYKYQAPSVSGSDHLARNNTIRD